MELFTDNFVDRVWSSRLRSKFLYLILLAGFIPLVLFTVPLYYFSTNTMESRARENLRNYARLASGELFRTFRAAENELKRLNSSTSESLPTETLMFDRVYRLDRDYQQLNSNRTPWSDLSRETFRALDRGEVVLSPPYRSKQNVTIALLIRTEQNNVLAGELNPLKLWNLTRTSFMGRSDEVVIVNEKGLVLNSSNHSTFTPFTSISSFSISQSEDLGFEFGESTFDSLGPVLWARKTLYLKARYKTDQWYVYLLRPQETVEAFPMQLVRTLGIYLLISILILIFIAFRFARRLANPVEDLIEATKNMAGGDIDQNITVTTGDELEDLANTINQLSNSLQETTVSRNYLENILSSINEGLVVIDDSGKIERMNDAFVGLVGNDENKLEGAPLDEMIRDESTNLELLKNLDEGGTIEQEEVSLRKSSGELTPVLISATPLIDKNREISGTVCVLTDISKLKQAERDLELYHETLDRSPDSIFIIDPDDATLLEVNETAHNLLGYSREELLELSIPDVEANIDDLSEWKELKDEIKQSGPLSFETELLTKQANTFPAEVHVDFVNLNGHSRHIAIVRDITERKKREEELRTSEKRFRQLAENIDEVFFVFNDDFSELLYVNPAYEDVSGGSVDKFYEDPLSYLETVHPDDREELEDKMDQVQSGEPEETIVRAGVDVDYERRVHIKAIPIEDQPGEVENIIGTAQDITEREKIREELKETAREKQTLLAEIHHRVKNNMQVMSSLLELQSYESDSERVSKVFENSQQRIRSMALVHEKLYQAENMAKLKMGEYIRELVDGLIRGQVRDQVRPDVNYDIDDELSLDLDRTIPCGLIINELISNSLEHAFNGTESEPEIRVRFVKRDDRYELTVKDNGTGMNDDFDPDGEMESLGMQLIHDLGERQLDGDVNIKSKNGVTFTINFPV